MLTPSRAKSWLRWIRGISVPRKWSAYINPYRHMRHLTSPYSLLLGNPAKAEKLLGWRRKVDFDSLVKEMVEADLKAAKSLVEDQN